MEDASRAPPSSTVCHQLTELAGHKLPGMSLGVYYGGATPDQAREVVEAVRLRVEMSPLLPIAVPIQAPE